MRVWFPHSHWHGEWLPAVLYIPIYISTVVSKYAVSLLSNKRINRESTVQSYDQLCQIGQSRLRSYVRMT